MFLKKHIDYENAIRKHQFLHALFGMLKNGSIISVMGKSTMEIIESEHHNREDEFRLLSLLVIRAL